jgi:amidase
MICDAFVDYPPVPVRSAPRGPLAGLKFGVKDLYDVAGYPTGCGHPLKREQSGIASRSASAVQLLLDAGAQFAGKTHTDEIAYSLNGENAHYGTPINPAAPTRIPGGSSNGSASATAGHLIDIGLGSDTGGSVRIPASYCGLFGIRTTHGAVSLDGAMPFAPSFDTVGWFARDAATMRRIGEGLLPAVSATPIDRLFVAEDAFALLTPGPHAAFRPALAALEGAVSRTEKRAVAAGGFDRVRDAFRYHQAYEIWQTHGAWVTRFRPSFGPGIAERFAWAATITAAEFEQAATIRAEVAASLTALLAPGTALVIPSAPDIAPLLETPPAQLEVFRNQALSLLALAGLARLPQLSIPGLIFDGCPIGISLVGARGQDMALLDFAAQLRF